MREEADWRLAVVTLATSAPHVTVFDREYVQARTRVALHHFAANRDPQVT